MHFGHKWVIISTAGVQALDRVGAACKRPVLLIHPGEATLNNRPIILSIPYMHRGLASVPAPDGVLYFNPGHDPAGLDWPVYTPAGLPVDPDMAARMVRDLNRLGRELGGEDLRARAATVLTTTNQNFRREMADLDAFASGGAPVAAEPARPDLRDLGDLARRQSQLTLLLAFDLEEQTLELDRLKRDYARMLTRFKQALGPEQENLDEDAALAGLSLKDIDASRPVLPWETVLRHMLNLLDVPAVLFTAEAALLSAWQDRGVEFVPAEPAILGLDQNLEPTEGLLTALATAGQLTGTSAGPARTFRVLYRPDEV